MAKRAGGVFEGSERVLEPNVVEHIAKIQRLEIGVAPSDPKRRFPPNFSGMRRLMRRCARDDWPSRLNRIRRRERFLEPAFIAEVGTGPVARATQLLQAFVDAVFDLGGSLVSNRGDVGGVVLLGEPHRLRLRERIERGERSRAEADRGVVLRSPGAFRRHSPGVRAPSPQDA